MILIKNVKIIDGSGKPAFPGDVLISGEKISAIGHFPNKKAETIIDGLGNYLTPGFIDVNSTVDHDLTIFTDPEQKESLRQGITTAIGGHGGASLAPLLYGSLKSIQKWVDINQINVNWHAFTELSQIIEKMGIKINFASLAGHSTIRRDLIGERSTDLTDTEIIVFKRILEQSLKEGAMGLSTGLNYVHARQAPQKEIKELVSLVAKSNGIYTTHLRNETNGIVGAINEIADIYKATGAKTIINRFLPFLNFENEFGLAYEIIKRSGDGLFFVTSILDVDIAPLYTILPIWAQKGNLQEMFSMLQNPASKKRIINELPKLKDDTVIITARDHSYLNSKTIKSFAENRGLTQSKALFELMKITKLKGLMALKNINYETVLKLVEDNKALITSPFLNFLQIANKKRWPLEKAVNKITNFPAQLFNLKNRGLIKENYFADLVMLHDDKIEKVIVNGELQRGHFLKK